MSKTTKKIIVLLLSFIMASMIFAGCSDTSSEETTDTDTTTADTSTETVETTEEEVAEVQTLTVWQADTWSWDDAGKEQDWDSYANCQAITEKIGIKLEYIIPTGTQDELLGPMIASDSLPDSMIITHYSVNAFINQMIEADMLWSFDDLLGEYEPEALEQLQSSTAYSYHTYTDGELYKFVGFESNSDKIDAFNLYGIPPTDGGSIFWVRGDILEAFGMDDITSLDDYTDYLRFVSENYPDVQPLMISGASYYNHLMATFGVPYSGASLAMHCNVTDDGEIELVVKNEAWIEYVQWFNMLYREGVITASQFTEQAQQANERKYSGMVGSFLCHYYDTHDNVNAPLIEAGQEDLIYVDVGPIQKEGVDFELPALRDTGCLAWVVSKNIELPEVAAKWFASIMYDDEINKLATGGFEGTDYTVNDDGTITCSDEFVTGINASIEEFCTETGLISKFLPWISGPNWVAFVENPMAGEEANPEAYEVSIKRQGAEYITDVWAEGFVDLPNTIDPTSDAGIAQTKCDETISNLFVKLVVAETDEEFQQIYDEALAELEQQGMDLYEQALTEEYQRQLALLEE